MKCIERKNTMTTEMTIEVDLKSKGLVQVQIVEGQIEEVKLYANTGGIGVYNREKREDINICLKEIFDEDIEAFKNILRNIEEDAEFFSYNKSFLDSKREAEVQELLTYIKGFNVMLAEKQKEVDKYTL